MSQKLFSYSIVLLIFFTELMFSSCQKRKPERAYVIGFSQCVGSDLWRRTMLEEIKMELSLHPGAKLIYTDANNNSNKQIKQVENMLEKGIDLLVISPNEAKPLTPVVEQAYSRGIPVIIIDRKTSNSSYTAYIGADNYQIGKMAGEYAGILLAGKGNVLEIMGLPGSSPAIERQRGFAEGLHKHKGIKVIRQIYGDWLKDNAKQQLLAAKDALAYTDVIFAHNDQMASGAKEVLKKLGFEKKIKIIGIDALPGQGGGLQMIESKVINASVLYPTGGKEAISTAFSILNKESFSKENILHTLIIDSSNVQLMKFQWNKVIHQQKDIERQQALLDEQKSLFDNQQFILNITAITLVLSVVFGGLAFFSLLENRKINKNLEANNIEILDQRNKLIEMSEKAERATEAKFNFFTNISHEFRTPLTLIISPLEDLMKNEKLNQMVGAELTLIHKNVFRLLRLINQLIDYRKIELGKMGINPSSGNIVSFVDEILESFRHIAKKKNIDLRLMPNEANVNVWFDVNMLDKVIFNLLSNALKFTAVNGKIHIVILKDEQFVYVKVGDDGPGMTAEETSQVFEHFYQVRPNSTNGSGLGLSLSKELMLLHHGDLLVESTKGQGTTFTLKLLLGAKHFDTIEKRNENIWSDELYENAKIYTTDLDDSYSKKSIDAHKLLKEQTILIIEDSLDLSNYLIGQFENQYEVFVANTGQSGINSAYEQVPDLIISDLMLPDFSGRIISERLKSDVRTSHIPIILLTAQGSIEQQINGIDSMADAYIVKPFNYAHLDATVKNLLKNRLLLKSHYTSDISSAVKHPISKSLDKKFINDFSAIVEQNLGNEKFSVDEISRSLGVSRVQLYRKVKALLDCSITDYILNRRLKKAKYLLMNDHYSISEITYMVGFSSPNYFSTVFKSKFGQRPSEFKKSQA